MVEDFGALHDLFVGSWLARLNDSSTKWATSSLVAEVGGEPLLDFGDGALAAGGVVSTWSRARLPTAKYFDSGWGPVSRWLA
jgi:hypothetical protein